MRMRGIKHRMMQFAGAFGVGLSAAGTALACAFHGYTPNPTIIDVLMGSEQAVLARPDPASPGRFAPTEALLGTLDGVALTDAVDAKTGALLAANPNASVLFARDGAYGPWLQLAVVDRDYRKVVGTVISKQSDWNLGGDDERYQLFAKHLNATNPELRQLAYLELDRAPYSVMKTLKIPKIAGLKSDIQNGDPSLLPIRILLAGLTDERSLAPGLYAGLDAAVQGELAFLGAFATALIELEGVAAAQRIAETYFAGDAVSLATREKLIEALAIHSQTAKPRVRKGVQAIVASLLTGTPELAGPVARQFGFRSDWSMGAPLAAAAKAQPPKAVDDLFAINQYLGLAARFKDK